MIEVDVLSMGYGTVGKLVMSNRTAPEAKVIYAYISTYAGAGRYGVSFRRPDLL